MIKMLSMHPPPLSIYLPLKQSARGKEIFLHLL